MKPLETSRLILRKWEKDDADDLFIIMKNPYVLMGGWEPHADINISIEILKEYIESDERLAIQLKNSGKVIGGYKSISR